MASRNLNAIARLKNGGKGSVIDENGLKTDINGNVISGGKTYSPTEWRAQTSNNPLIPSKDITSNSSTNSLIPDIPKYKDYEYQEFKATPPKFNITSSGDESYTPTLQAKQLWDQNQQLQAGINNQNWQNNFGLWGALADLGMQQQQMQEQQRQFDAGLREQERQFNFGNTLDWSRFMGMPLQPVASGGALYNQTKGLIPWERQAQEQALNFDNYWKQQDYGLQQQQLGLQAQDQAFDQDYKNRALELEATTANSGGGNDLTQTEKQRVATTKLLDTARSRYDELKGKKQYPLYYTINSLIRDPEWVNAAVSSGANVKTVIDNLIMEVTKMSPEDYFQTETGSELESLYRTIK